MIRFLDLYREHECLWNPKLVDYKNPKSRKRAILAIMRDFGSPSLSYCEVKNKIKTIRTIYSRELAKVMRCKRTVYGTRAAYKPTLAWFKKADSFLREVKQSRAQGTNPVGFQGISRDSDAAEDNTRDDSAAAAYEESYSSAPELSPFADGMAPGCAVVPSPDRGQTNTTSNQHSMRRLEVLVQEIPENRSFESAHAKPVTSTTFEEASKRPDSTDFQRADAFPQPLKRSPDDAWHRDDTTACTDDGWQCGEEMNDAEDILPDTPTLEEGRTPLSCSKSQLDAEGQEKASGSRGSGGRRRAHGSLLHLIEEKLTSVPAPDKFDFAAKSWACTLREVEREQQIFAEKLISDVLYEAQLGNLHRNCRVQTAGPQAEGCGEGGQLEVLPSSQGPYEAQGATYPRRVHHHAPRFHPLRMFHRR